MKTLVDLKLLAQSKTIGFSITYCEADDSWFGCINSIAPAEEWVGKNRSLSCAIDDLEGAIRKL